MRSWKWFKNKKSGKDEGAATTEFVIIFPVYIFMLFWVIDVGYMSYLSVSLKSSLTELTRDLMLGELTGDSDDNEIKHDILKQEVCNHFGIYNCEDGLQLQITPATETNIKLSANDICKYNSTDPDVEPPKVVGIINEGQCIEDSIDSTTSSTEIMLMEACLTVSPLIPALWNTDELGEMRVRTFAAYLKEPC